MASYPLASLYVGDLHPDVNEAILYERFSPAGVIVSIQVCRDMMTKRSLGYAYVNFTNHQDAELALDVLNFEPINGKACRIMWSQRDPGLKKSGFDNIFIKNLDKAIDNKALYDTFSAFGNILSCKVATDETGESRGFGYIYFEKQEDAERTIKKVNGMLVNDKKVFVGMFVGKKERQATGQGRIIFNNLYIKGFGPEFNEPEMMTALSKYGEILSVKIVKDEHGVNKGFGFCSFDDADSAMRAQEELHQCQLPTGDKLYVQRAQRRREREGELKKKFEIMKQQKRQETKKQMGGARMNDMLGAVGRGRQPQGQPSRPNATPRMKYRATAGINITHLSSADPKQQKQILGETLFPIIYRKYPQQAGKITGMLLELEISELLFLLESVDQLNAKMEEAYEVLQKHQSSNTFETEKKTNIPRAYNPALRLPGPSGMRGGTNVAPGVHGGGPYGQGIQQMGGARMNDMRGAVGRGRQPQGQQPRPNATPRMKYTATAGQSRPNMHQMPIMMQQPQMIPGGPQQKDMSAKSINITHLSSADPKQQKQILGETLFPIIYRKYPQQAGKITGMLLELEISELLFLLESVDQLSAKMEEAYEILQKDQSSIAFETLKQQKHILGETLFPIIYRKYPQQAGRITGMLLELEISELLFLLESVDQLSAKMEEAYEILQKDQSSIAFETLEQQKHILGETLFPIIYRKYPQQAGRITGMLLELEISELLFLLESVDQLNAKMEEAYEVLQKHQGNNAFETEKKRSDPSLPNVSTKTRSSITEQSSCDFIKDRSKIQYGFDTQVCKSSIEEEVFTTSKSEAIYPRTLPDNNHNRHLKEFPNTKREIHHPPTMSNDRYIQKMDNQKSSSEKLQSKLMSKIQVWHPNSAKNITEILVDEMDPEELVFLLNNTEHLNAKVEEVYKELQKSPILLPKPRMEHVAAPSINTSTPEISPNSLPLQPHQFISEIIDKHKTDCFTPEPQRNTLQSKFREQIRIMDTPTVNELLREENVDDDDDDDDDNLLMSLRNSEDFIFEAAKKQYPNDANLIVQIISEKCKWQEQNILVNSKALLDREIEKAYSKIRRLDSPVLLL